MPRTKLALATCLPLLALGALASAASAATAGWMVNGSLLSGTKAVGTASISSAWQLEVAGIIVSCNGSTIDNVHPELVAPNQAKAISFQFTECAVNSGSCFITKTLGIVPTITESTLDGALGIKETIKPQTKTLFATIKFEGAECLLAGTDPVTGKISVLDPSGQDEKTMQEFTSTTTAASGELRVGSSGASVKGTALTKLASGEQWSFL